MLKKITKFFKKTGMLKTGKKAAQDLGVDIDDMD